MLIGYARCSTEKQDLTAQCQQLKILGVSEENIFTDRGFSARCKHRPGLEKSIVVLREGDVMIVTKLDRLARSVSDAHKIAETINSKGAALQIGTSRYDPNDPTGKLVFNVLAMMAEFERDLISMRTKEGLAIAKAAGRLAGRGPKLSPLQEEQVASWIEKGELTQRQIAEVLDVHPSTISRARRRLISSGRLPA